MPRFIRKNDESTPPPGSEKRKKPVAPAAPRKRRNRPDDDDDSVDSRGNIRGLIAYSDEEENTESSDTSFRLPPAAGKGSNTKKKPGNARTPRRAAAIAARKKINEEERALKKKKAAAPTVTQRKKQRSPPTPEEEEEEEESTEEETTEEEEDSTPGDTDETEATMSDDDDDSDTDDSDTEESDDDELPLPTKSPHLGGIELVISDLADALGSNGGPPKPKKYKLRKEPENVRRFVKLVQTEVDPTEEDIDRDIDYFKTLTPGAQDRLLTKLQNKIDPPGPTIPLKFQILSKDVPSEVERVAMAKYQALQSIDPSTTEYYKTSQWIHGYTELPLGVYRDLPVRLEDGADACSKFMTGVRDAMDTAIYGHDEAKLQIMQFVSAWIANPKAAGNVLSLHGPPGTGKTTLVKDGIAKALGRPFHFITLGGATDASYLDGHSYTYEGSTWGRIVDVLIKSKCMNPVIYFDELDKVSETPKGEEINNLLIHLTDQSQNDRFQDKYFAGVDLDLSRCLFIFSHNAPDRVNPILRDRMYNIAVEGFGIKEKQVIAEQYLVPAALREVGLFEKVGISREIIKYIVENHTGEERGVRELKRCIQTIVSKLNMLRFYNDPSRVPFAIKGFALPFSVRTDHVDLLLKRRAPMNESIAHMYT